MRYVIGIDGGGTKTEALVLAEDGREWNGFLAGSTNPHAVTFERASGHLASLLDQVFALPQLASMHCAAVCLGLAGVETEQERSRFRAFMDHCRTERGLAFATFLNNDAQIALMATLRDDRGIIAISGTGSIVFGLTPKGQKYRAGGWGHLLGDEGSGYDIGIRTLRTVMRSYDGIEPPTLLTGLIAEAYGFSSITELRTFIYNPDLKKQDIARFAEFCIRASGNGDEAALSILRDAARDLSVTAAALIRKNEWFAACDLVTTGSIFKHSDVYSDVFRERLGELAPRIRIHASTRDPAYGAALLAWKQLR